MPGFPDKIIINHNGNRGMHQLIKSDLDTLEILGQELIDRSMLKETFDLRDEMKSLCADHHAAQMKYHEGLKALIEKTAERIDDKIAQLP